MKSINKEKIIAAALALALITGTMLPATAVVEAASVNEEPAASSSVKANTKSDYTYSILDNGTLEITKYTGKDTKVTIPSKINGYTVSSIGYSAFEYCDSITSIIIPNSVTEIGSYAFDNCKALTSITIPNSVTKIKNYAFMNCSSLKSVTIPNSVTKIEGSLFSTCRSLTNVTIPNSVTEIGNYAFEYCSSLKSVTIPNSVTKIGNSAFTSCRALTNITIPNSVTEIGNWAFESCSSLTSITISNSVTKIGDNAFIGCGSLTAINVLSENNNYSSIDGVLYNKKKTELIYCPPRKSKAYKVPTSVTSIKSGAFGGCNLLTSITIPNGVIYIGDSAFVSCSSLTAINVSSGNNNYSSADGVLYNKKKTKLICYPAGKSGAYKILNSVTEIGEFAVSCCNLTSITIPNSVTKIGEDAFWGCWLLKSITIPNSVTEIGKDAFWGCSSLTIYGTKGSAAEKYANENGIAFKTTGTVKPLTNNSTITATNITAGSAITINAKATGGTAPYKYYYYCKAPGSTKYVQIKADEKTASRTTKPTAVGTYYYSVKIVDAKGNSKIKIFTVKVNKATTPLTNNSTISATSVKAGTTITLNAKATGGTAPYKYYYYCKAPGSTKYVQIKADEKTASRITKPTAVGTYYYSVKIVDAKGNSKIKIFTVKVNKAATPLTNNSTISATNIKAGTAITLKSKATGGTAPYKYYYYCKAPGSTKYVQIKTDEKTASRITKPTVKGTYNYCINIVDANGIFKIKIFTVTVK